MSIMWNSELAEGGVIHKSQTQTDRQTDRQTEGGDLHAVEGEDLNFEGGDLRTPLLVRAKNHFKFLNLAAVRTSS